MSIASPFNIKPTFQSWWTLTCLSQVMSLVSNLQSVSPRSKYSKAQAFKFLLAQMKSGSSGLKSKSSQQLVPSLSDSVKTIKMKIKSSTEGQEPINVEVRRSKVQAKSKMAKHKLKPCKGSFFRPPTCAGVSRELKHKERKRNVIEKRCTAESATLNASWSART